MTDNPSRPDITDEMVENALREWFQVSPTYRYFQSSWFPKMRAALEAALPPVPEDADTFGIGEDWDAAAHIRFIMPSGRRARAAYQIIEVRLNTRTNPRSYARLKCWRVRRDQIPAEAIVHGWEWAKR